MLYPELWYVRPPSIKKGDSLEDAGTVRAHSLCSVNAAIGTTEVKSVLQAAEAMLGLPPRVPLA